MTETRCRLRDGMGRYREVTHEQLPERFASRRSRKTTVIGSGIARSGGSGDAQRGRYDNKSGTAELYALSLLQRQSVFFYIKVGAAAGFVTGV